MSNRQRNSKIFKAASDSTHSKAIVSTGVSEVNDQLKWFVIEWLECEQHMVYQQVSIDLSNPETIIWSLGHSDFSTYIIDNIIMANLKLTTETSLSGVICPQSLI